MANRNRTKMSRLIFERLAVAAQQRGVQIHESKEIRYIKRISNDDAALMSEAEVSAQSISRSQKLVRINWKGEKYFVIFGFNEPDQCPLGVDYSILTPGMFAASVYAADIYPSHLVTGAQIRDAIELDHGGILGYEGHDLSVIQPLFSSCITFKVSSQEEYFNSDYRMLGAIAARSYVSGPLHIDPETLKQLAYLFESGPEFLPYRSVLQGLLSFAWESLFLEAYRCLEQLYAQPHAAALTSLWTSTLPLRDVVKLLESCLSWRPKEDESLFGLIKSCDSSSIQQLCLAFDISYSSGDVEKSSKDASGKIYKLRNNVVHYRPIHEIVLKSDEECNQIIRAMFLAIGDIYRKHEKSFFC